MGTFKTKKTIYGSSAKIPYVAEQICQAFISEGYDATVKDMAAGKEVNITKGGLFKAAIGLRSALNIKIKPAKDGNIDFEAGVSVLKQQLIPTMLTLWLFSPVVIAQIWGMIKQSGLDEKALAVAEEAVYGDSSVNVK